MAKLPTYRIRAENKSALAFLLGVPESELEKRFIVVIGEPEKTGRPKGSNAPMYDAAMAELQANPELAKLNPHQLGKRLKLSRYTAENVLKDFLNSSDKLTENT